MQVNQLRGLPYEFGVVLPQSWRASIEAVRNSTPSLADQLPAMPTDSLHDQFSRLLALHEQIQRIELRITHRPRDDEACRRISEIRALAVDRRSCGSGYRQRAGIQVRLRICRLSWTGAATELLGWPSQARRHWQTRRCVLADVTHSRRTSCDLKFKTFPERLRNMLVRRPTNVVSVALANKLARPIWALLA
jgi:transposase